MKEYGFIMLDRSIVNWRWFKDMKTAWLFINLLLMANYTQAQFKSHDIKRGQVVTSLHGLMEQSGLTYQEVRTALNHLKSTKDVTVQTTSKCTIITVENYEQFACATNTLTIKQQTNNKQTTNKQQQYNKYNNKNKYNNYKNRTDDYVDEKAEERYRIFESKSLFND